MSSVLKLDYSLCVGGCEQAVGRWYFIILLSVVGNIYGSLPAQNLHNPAQSGKNIWVLCTAHPVITNMLYMQISYLQIQIYLRKEYICMCKYAFC